MKANHHIRILTALLGLCVAAALPSCASDEKSTADTATSADTAGDAAASSDSGGGADAAAGDTAASDGDGSGGSDAALADVQADTTVDAKIEDAAGSDGTAADGTAADGTVADSADAAVDVPADVPPPAPTCEDYCAVVAKNCTGANAQYADAAACVVYCKQLGKLPLGKADDKAGNTVGCRTYHAGAAGADPATHCAHAGKSGGNVCGTWCDNYCQLSEANCTAGNVLYSKVGDCASTCATASSTGKSGDTSGDSIQCRIYHLGVAGIDPGSATTHCPHGLIPGAAGSPCGPKAVAAPTCETYCKAVTQHCTGANSQYADESACVSYCKTSAKLPAGTAADTSGNTIGCRTYHAGAAMADPGTHCAHAGKSGGNVCGTWCDNYCQLATANCTESNALYTKAADCTTACATASAGGKAGDVSGDSLQCRIYHLGVAGADAASATTHCPHGKIPSGAGTPCGAAAPVAKTVKVATSGFEFQPKEVMISVGDSVEFTTASNHNVVEVEKAAWTAGESTAKSGGFSVDFGATKAVTFSKAGTYYYVCKPHAGMGMKGVITVM